MEILDNSTLVTATGGHGPHHGGPAFVPAGYLVPASPRGAFYGGDAPYAAYAPVAAVRWAPRPATWWRGYR